VGLLSFSLCSSCRTILPICGCSRRPTKHLRVTLLEDAKEEQEQSNCSTREAKLLTKMPLKSLSSSISRWSGVWWKTSSKEFPDDSLLQLRFGGHGTWL